MHTASQIIVDDETKASRVVSPDDAV